MFINIGLFREYYSAAAVYKGRTKKKDDYEWEEERNGKHLRPTLRSSKEADRVGTIISENI
jgi:hypothetical protein